MGVHLPGLCDLDRDLDLDLDPDPEDDLDLLDDDLDLFDDDLDPDLLDSLLLSLLKLNCKPKISH